jgi:CubicO group peptidase (beta-lactamase class C family)
MKDAGLCHQEPNHLRSIAPSIASKHIRPGRGLRPARALADLLPLLLALLAAGCGSSGATNYNSTVIREAMVRSGATAMTAALVSKEGVIWSASLGDADKGIGAEVTPETLFGIGSVSKMLATVAVMKLVEQGRVALNEPLTTYLPLSQFSMLSPEYANIKVRMLLNHSAGFPGGDLRNGSTEAPFTGFAAQMMADLKVQRLKHAPGYLCVYSNDGFTMVENLVKAVTGMAYLDFVRQEILTPLEMGRSRFADVVLPAGSYARPYTGATPQPYISLNLYATGGVYSTAADMARLAMMFLNGGRVGSQQFLTTASIDAMAQDETAGTFSPAPSDYVRYGLGWDTVAQPGLKAVGVRGLQKGGAIDGFNGQMYRSTLLVAPDQGLAVVVMMASNQISSDLAIEVSEKIMLRALADRGAIAAVPSALIQPTLPIATPTAAEKAAFSGYYGASGTLYRLTFAADDALTLEKYDNEVWKPERQSFRKRNDGWYAADNDPITGLRLLTGDGRNYIDQRTLSGAGHYAATHLLAQQLETRGAVSAAWQARLSTRWLPVNTDFLAGFLNIDFDPRTALQAVAGLPGYLLLDGKILRDMTPQAADRMDGMFLQIPQMEGRDLIDAAIEVRGGADRLRSGSSLYRPQSTVPLLAPGTTTVTIDGEGLSEWRQLPVTGTVAITGATAWRLYKLFNDGFTQVASGAGSGTATLPGSGDAAYLFLYGPPGATVTLTVAP